MQVKVNRIVLFFVILLLSAALLIPFNKSINKLMGFNTLANTNLQNNIKIKQRNPVVNEGNRIFLTATDLSDQNLSGVLWQSGSPDIAQVDPNSGEVRGVKQGFATITAKQGSNSISTFVTVARVRKNNGVIVPGDTKTDSNGQLYLSNPKQHVIMKASKALSSSLEIFAGVDKKAGIQDGIRRNALFAGPTAIAIDNGVNGGIYVSDTLNHSVRKISFNDQVETLLGLGSPGLNSFDLEGKKALSNTLLNGPRGIAVDSGGNLYIADTDNHAIYFANVSQGELFLLAGKPGESGNNDGTGQQARFKRPAGMALSSDGKILTVADEDNNRVRIIEIIRNNNQVVTNVSTLGAVTSTNNIASQSFENSSQNLAIEFDKPSSVGFDGAGNLYVVDNSSVKIITRPLSQQAEVIELAQPNVSFNQAVSVSIAGNEVFVLDAEATNETEAIKVVTVGAPEIESVTPKSVSMDNGGVVTIKGKNFAPESIVTFADKAIENIEVISANEIKVTILAQKAPGTSVLSVLTRGGLAQQELNVVAKPVGELAVGEITTIAGGLISNGDGGLATKASLFGISSLLVDSNRNLFIADSINQRVRKIDSQTGIITTIAGGGTAFRDGELALLSQIRPGDLALDSNGNLFIVDNLTASVRRVDLTTNIITTVAGGELGQASGDGGLATEAILGDILSKITIAFKPNGNLLIGASNKIREVDSKTGIITTIAGTGNREFAGDGGPATQANINPFDILVDSIGNIFIAEFDNKRIRKIDANTGIINTIAGNGNGYTGRIENNKPATEVAIIPISLVLGPNNILFANAPVLVKIDLTTNIINRLDYKDPDNIDGLISSNGLAIDGLGNIFMDVISRVIMLPISQTSVEAKTVAGSNLVNLRGNGDLAVNAGLGFASGVVADSQNNLFISDLINEVVRKVDSSTGIISTFAGSGPKIIFTPSQGDGKIATDPDVVFSPDSLEVDKAGNLLILDTLNEQIRNVNANTQIISTVAGSFPGSKKDGIKAKKASLTDPIDLTIDNNGNIFLSEIRRVRKIDAKTKKITTIAGTGRVGDINNIPDNVPATSVEIGPREIVVDPQGNIFINDRNRIRRIDGQTNIITTIAGNGKIGFRDADTPLNTSLGTVSGLAMDKAGNIFIASSEFVSGTSVSGGFFNTRIWRLDAQSGKLTVFASGQADEYSGDGGQVANARVAGTPVLSIDANGNLLIVSTDIQTFSYVRLVKLSN